MQFRILEIPPGLTPGELSMTARMVLASLLRDVYSISTLPEIVRLPSGKLFFADLNNIHFSLSHCRHAVMAAVDVRPIGCDIEDIVEDMSEELLQFSFNRREQQQIRNNDTPWLPEKSTNNEVFTAIWTRKEAIVKRLGDIPDNPCDWPSDTPGVTTSISPSRLYAFSISTTP